MAYREVAMWEILAVLERIGRGESQASVSHATGHCRKTIRRYVREAQRLGWSPGTDPPTEALAAEVFLRHRTTGEREPGDAEQELLPHLKEIRKWLTPEAGQKRGLKLTKVRQLLERQGTRVAYSSLHRFAVKHCDFGKAGRTTVRMAECEPGELAEVDFGKLGLVFDPETGRRRVAWALSVVLVHSRHQYVHVTYSQTLADVIDGLEDAWTWFGGVPRRVVLDNLKSAVFKADRYDPVFQRTFDEYARHRGFVTDATRVRDPKGKPVVERGVPYIRQSFFRGEDWLNLDHVQREVLRWCLETAGTRIHGTTRQRPLAVFENVEKKHLLPLEGERFDTPQWGEYKVHPDHHNNQFGCQRLMSDRGGNDGCTDSTRGIMWVPIWEALRRPHPSTWLPFSFAMFRLFGRRDAKRSYDSKHGLRSTIAGGSNHLSEPPHTGRSMARVGPYFPPRFCRRDLSPR